jgi:hypothetical protein
MLQQKYKIKLGKITTPTIIHHNIKIDGTNCKIMGPRGFWEVKASRFRDIGT